MLRLFAIKNSRFNDDEVFKKYLALADGERRAKIEKLTVREKKNQSLAAGAILPLALRAAGYSGNFEIGYEDNGKPYFIQPKGLFFNISHSGEWTLVALSDGEVGCDIQKTGPVDMRVAERFFTAEESKALEEAGGGARDLFFRMWTIKESYLKALGTGLARPLNSFSVRFTESGARIVDPNSADKWSVTEPTSLSGYKIACCSNVEQGAPEFEIINIR